MACGLGIDFFVKEKEVKAELKEVKAVSSFLLCFPRLTELLLDDSGVRT